MPSWRRAVSSNPYVPDLRSTTSFLSPAIVVFILPVPVFAMATKRSSFPPDSSSSKDDVKGGPSRAATQQTSGPLRADRAGPDDAQHWATFVPPPLFEAPALPDPLSGIVEEMLEDLETRYGRIGRRSNQTARLVAAETALRVAHALAVRVTLLSLVGFANP